MNASGDGDDPLARLGLARSATLDDVRAARRRLAKQVHPDHGGDATAMRALNATFDAAVKAVRARADAPAVAPAPSAPPRPDPPPEPSPVRRGHRPRVEHDAPSFTIDVLPVDAFEALLVVTAWHGDVLVDDPPYLLEVHLQDPSPCWCRLELLPEAGGTIVNLTVLGTDAGPTAEEVRDLWVASLNALGA
jgi:hypothetical protein